MCCVSSKLAGVIIRPFRALVPSGAMANALELAGKRMPTHCLARCNLATCAQAARDCRMSPAPRHHPIIRCAALRSLMQVKDDTADGSTRDGSRLGTALGSSFFAGALDAMKRRWSMATWAVHSAWRMLPRHWCQKSKLCEASPPPHGSCRARHARRSCRFCSTVLCQRVSEAFEAATLTGRKRSTHRSSKQASLAAARAFCLL